MANLRKIAKAIRKSNYSIDAVGWRNTSLEELIGLLDIIINNNEEKNITKNINNYYKNRIETILFNKNMQKNSCTIQILIFRIFYYIQVNLKLRIILEILLGQVSDNIMI